VPRRLPRTGRQRDGESWAALTQALRQAISTGPAAPFTAGDVLVNIGTSWWIPDYLRYVEHLQHERGVLYAPFMHDCIPLRRPELCSAGLVDEFRDWFADAMRVADIVLANSSHTAGDVAHYGSTAGPLEPLVVRLDARFDDGPQPGQAAAARLDALTHARLGIRRPFALFVSTVEARKNHVFVFECWKSLIERHGEDAPDLICVGKLGWLVEYTLNWLKVHPGLAGRVRLVGTISDLDLSALYRTALFTVYCSHYEGWGLPVTESLCHGRVPLVPHHSSLPEAGGTFAIYYQPGSHEEFIGAAERMMAPRERAEAEARIRARFRPRNWSDVLGQITSTVRTAPVRTRLPEPPLQAGCIYSLARNPPIGSRPGAPLKHGLGWHSAEAWGCWSRLAKAQLLLRLPPGDADLLYVVLRGGPAEQIVNIEAGTMAPVRVCVPTGRRHVVRLRLDPAVLGGDLLLSLEASPYSLKPFTEGGDPREVGVGLESVTLTDRRDTASRLDLLETLMELC
jgi:glycosyltransferase involved in cell wall biosynthesis